MKNKSLGQKVQCDSCPWSGYQAELEQVTLNNGDDADCCPSCADIGISYMGDDE